MSNNIIIQQTSRNIIFTYIGILFGAMNIILLYPLFLKDTYYGLVTFTASSANILMPIFSFGVSNALIKFHKNYAEDSEQQHRFNFLSIITPVISGLFFILIIAVFCESILNFAVADNELLRSHFNLIYALAFTYTIFEIAYSWEKTHLKSVYGNFLKEIFHRVFVSITLVLVHYEWIAVESFIYILVGIFIVRSILMVISALKTKFPVIKLSLPDNWSVVLKYNIIMLIMGLMATLMLSVDKFFIGSIISLEQVAFYSVASFIATIISIPSRSMLSIANPITAQLLVKKNWDKLNVLYKKTSNTLLVISGYIFIVININLPEFVQLLPENYSHIIAIVFILSCSRITENIIGNNNSIFFNSDYFRYILIVTIFSSISIIVFTYLFTIWWGTTGTAFAILFNAIVCHSIKILLVKKLFGIHPFSRQTFYILLCIASFLPLFYFWNLPLNLYLNIGIKTLLISILYVYCIYRFPLSSNVRTLLDGVWSKIQSFIKLRLR